MKKVNCGKCGSEFDVTAMKPGSAFACGKCRGVVTVPDAAPPTVVLTPDQMKKALDEARAGAAGPAASAGAKAQPKLPAAMQVMSSSGAGWD